MLQNARATPMIAVRDIDRARDFYAGTLGLSAKDAMGGEVLEVTSGGSVINVAMTGNAKRCARVRCSSRIASTINTGATAHMPIR